MTFPRDVHTGTHAMIVRSIQRRAVALCALQCGLDKDAAAERVGVERNMVNRWLRPDWKPGA